MAVREGFEPSVAVKLRIFSKDVLSTTQPPHQTLSRARGTEASIINRESLAIVNHKDSQIFI
jgi:hypothetical protein